MLNTINIFAYGTLKPGESNYQQYCVQVLEAKRAVTFGKLFALPLGYPAMTKGESLVKGFLLSFPECDILLQLDLLEGFNPSTVANNEYNRQLIETYNLDLVSLGLAWAYLMTPKQVDSLSGIFLDDGWWSGCGLSPFESSRVDKSN